METAHADLFWVFRLSVGLPFVLFLLSQDWFPGSDFAVKRRYSHVQSFRVLQLLFFACLFFTLAIYFAVRYKEQISVAVFDYSVLFYVTGFLGIYLVDLINMSGSTDYYSIYHHPAKTFFLMGSLVLIVFLCMRAILHF